MTNDWTTKPRDNCHLNHLGIRCVLESFNSWLSMPVSYGMQKAWPNHMVLINFKVIVHYLFFLVFHKKLLKLIFCIKYICCYNSFLTISKLFWTNYTVDFASSRDESVLIISFQFHLALWNKMRRGDWEWELDLKIIKQSKNSKFNNFD